MQMKREQKKKNLNIVFIILKCIWLLEERASHFSHICLIVIVGDTKDLWPEMYSIQCWKWAGTLSDLEQKLDYKVSGWV